MAYTRVFGTATRARYLATGNGLSATHEGHKRVVNLSHRARSVNGDRNTARWQVLGC